MVFGFSIKKRLKRTQEAGEKYGYERVRGFAASAEVFPVIRRVRHHVSLDVGGGKLSADFVPSSQSFKAALEG